MHAGDRCGKNRNDKIMRTRSAPCSGEAARGMCRLGSGAGLTGPVPSRAGAFRGSVLVEKLVVEDGGRQPESVLNIVNRVLDTNQPPLAKYIAVLLAGDFFGHFEDQFHQRIRRQLLRAMKEHARLADVLDQALV